MAEYHVPVMLEACLEGLNIKPDGVYVDVTFGGGGHSRAILKALNSKGKLIAFDQDEDAKANLPEDKRLLFIDQNFEFIANHLQYQGLYPVDGVLADLGVSSHQFDASQRGFTFRDLDAPLDMRMNRSQPVTAATIINTYTADQLATIFRLYGELPRAGRIASHLVSSRSVQAIATAGDLRKVLESFAPKFKDYKFWAQVFQALRIEVNRELEVLKKLLEQCSSVLKEDGRLVVMSYHSLEDRLVKNYINTGNIEGKQEKDFYGNLIRPFEPVIRQAGIANENELEINSRARSAKLRIARRTGK